MSWPRCGSRVCGWQRWRNILGDRVRLNDLERRTYRLAIGEYPKMSRYEVIVLEKSSSDIKERHRFHRNLCKYHEGVKLDTTTYAKRIIPLDKADGRATACFNLSDATSSTASRTDRKIHPPRVPSTE